MQSTLSLLEERNKIHEDRLKLWDGYHRFSIGPIPGLGPSDFLSAKRVRNKTDDYIKDHQEEFRQIGYAIRQQMDPKPKRSVPRGDLE